MTTRVDDEGSPRASRSVDAADRRERKKTVRRRRGGHPGALGRRWMGQWRRRVPETTLAAPTSNPIVPLLCDVHSDTRQFDPVMNPAAALDRAVQRSKTQFPFDSKP